MGIDPEHLTNSVIVPTLHFLGDRFSSPAAVNLMLGTAMVESRLQWLVQLREGPARGLWQMEPATHMDHLAWLSACSDSELRGAVAELKFPGMSPTQQLAGNLYYACAMCRVHYRRVADPLPSPDDVSGMAVYWKRFYNTRLGSGDVHDYITAWREHTGKKGMLA